VARWRGGGRRARAGRRGGPPPAAGWPWLRPQPWAETFEDVVQELGAIKAALQHRAAAGEDVQRLLQAAEWLEGRGGELLGRDRSAG
jgi:hypothetical protein